MLFCISQHVQRPCIDRVCQHGRVHTQPQTQEGKNGQAWSNGTYSSSALALTSTPVRALHTLNKEQWG